MSEKQRRKKLAEETEGYPRDEQHVYKGNLKEDLRAGRPIDDPMAVIEKAAEDFRKEREEKLKDEGDSFSSEEKEVSLSDLPIESYDKKSGEHVFGLDEYEQKLKDLLAGKGGEDNTSATDSNIIPSLDDNGLQGSKEVPDEPHKGGGNLSTDNREAIQSKLAEIQAERQRREKVWNNFKSKYNVSDDGSISLEDYKKAFYDMNTDEANKLLMEKVLNVLNGNINELMKVGKLDPHGAYGTSTGNIQISKDWISRGLDDNAKAATLLHEMIHRATLDSIRLYKIPALRHLMSKETRAAIKELYSIHDSLSRLYTGSRNSFQSNRFLRCLI